MFGFLSVLKPAGKIVLKVVLREIFNAEHLWGSGEGKNKLGYVLDRVDEALSKTDGKQIKDITVDVVEFVNAVVEVLNQLGLFNDDPGVEIEDPKALVKAVLKAIEEAVELLRNFS